jgi:hypothetical protein
MSFEFNCGRCLSYRNINHSLELLILIGLCELMRKSAAIAYFFDCVKVGLNSGKAVISYYTIRVWVLRQQFSFSQPFKLKEANAKFAS